MNDLQEIAAKTREWLKGNMVTLFPRMLEAMMKIDPETDDLYKGLKRFEGKRVNIGLMPFQGEGESLRLGASLISIGFPFSVDDDQQVRALTIIASTIAAMFAVSNVQGIDIAVYDGEQIYIFRTKEGDNFTWQSGVMMPFDPSTVTGKGDA